MKATENKNNLAHREGSVATRKKKGAKRMLPVCALLLLGAVLIGVILSAVLKHEHEFIPNVTAPACTEQGYTAYICDCGESYTDDYVNARGHMLGAWELIKDPTQEEAGLKAQKCSVCDVKLTQTAVIASLGLEFTSNGDGTCIVSGIGTCTDTEIVIPAAYNGERVTGIGESAFSDCLELTSIIIPESVTSIGKYAFVWCRSLTSIMLPDSITSIDDGVFEICSALTSIAIPDSITSIGQGAFFGCDGLTSITLGKGVTTIEDDAFADCYKLAEVINRSSLNITTGSSDHGQVAYYAFEVHNGSSKVDNQDGYWFYTYNGTHYLLGYCGNETELVLPDTYNGENYQINQYAFYNRDTLKSVVIPDSVTGIGDRAFYDCYDLTSVTIGGGVTSIGVQAFWYCEALTGIAIPDSVKIIGEEAFQHCRGLTGLTLGNGVESIEEGAFHGCTGLTSLTIPDSVMSIGKDAFNWCFGLTSVQFSGTIAQWNAIAKGANWQYKIPVSKVICSDGGVLI